MPSRRTFLASAATVTTTTTALAGCLGDDSTDGDPSGTTDHPSGSPTTESNGVSIDSVEPSAVDGPIRVLPEGIRTLLVEAARTDEEVRGEYDVRAVVPPAPDLLAFETVELRGTDGVDGTYTMDVEGGNSYDMQFVAEPASSVPEDATVVDVETLPAARREFVRTAAGEDDAVVEPHTELGTWARRTFDGGYLRYEGTVYEGREQAQTDAGLLTGTVWYVLSLTPADEATDATVLDCSSVDADEVDALLEIVHRDGDYPKTDAEPSADLRSFASATEYCMLHKLTLAVTGP